MPVELNMAATITAVARSHPDRAAITQGERSLSYGQFTDRARRLARYLHDAGLGCHTDRAELAGHQSGQHLLAQYLHNGVEYVEGLLGSYLARVAPFNVNYRYQPDELRYLLRDSGPSVIQYHQCFAPMLGQILDDLPNRPALFQVADGSGEPLLPGAVDYEQALASAPPVLDLELSPDDLYIIYTGGTTGMPKGVLWRQADVAVTTMSATNRRANREWDSVEELVQAIPAQPHRVLPCAPLMHGAAQWAVLQTLLEGGTVVLPEQATTFEAAHVLDTVARHRVTAMTIVGDAFARPLTDQLERGRYDLSSLKVIVSGGAALSPEGKRRLIELIPGLRVRETIGSSESGIQGSQHSDVDTKAGTEAGAPRFQPGPKTVVVSPDLSRFLAPGHDGTGWIASSGRIPLGYLGDEQKTAKTFPVVAGRRVSIPGDRARLLPDGTIELLGRDSMTINSGGEKVFVEEVEAVLKSHPEVVDAVVCARPSERWGAEVAAVVVGPAVGVEELLEYCRSRLSRYKVPKTIHFVEEVRRSAAGKPDYRWAIGLVRETDQPPSQQRTA
jgi:fatty-acyl-CoA synthase